MNREVFEQRSGMFPLSYIRPMAVENFLDTEDLKTIIAHKKKKLTQRDIANRLGITQQHISLILQGKRNNPKLLLKIKAILKKEGLI